jgi:hypothetical protein
VVIKLKYDIYCYAENMEFECVTSDSGGCECYVELRKLIASVSVAQPKTHVKHESSVKC